jgi:flavin reductase (DIM6/NTAB) family NADH-FMN oxidoreductase RutF/rubredoxin
MDSSAFLKMTYGIYLICSRHGEELSGYIANTAFQVTAEPPQIAISCHKQNTSAHIIEMTGHFNLSVLEKDTDAGLIGMFGYQSGNEPEKFSRVNHKTGKNGAPVILSHAIAYFECEVVDKFDMGSHYLFIGRVAEAELLESEKEPLTYAYFREEMKLMAPERAPTYIDKAKLNPQTDQTSGNTGKEQPAAEEQAKGIGENYICTICGFVYDPEIGDPEHGVAPGTPFEEIHEDWVCPVCAAAKSFFISEN